MEDTGVTWIVTADAGSARVFAEPARTGPVRELPDLHFTAHGDELAHHAHHRGRPDGGHEGEAKFMRRVANRVALAATDGQFQNLVLMAPPRALGLLRSALPPAVAARIEVTDPHERTHENAESVRRALRHARSVAAPT